MNLHAIVSVISYNDILVLIIVTLICIGIGCSIWLNWKANRCLGRVGSVWRSPTGSIVWFAVYFVGIVTLEDLAFLLPEGVMHERYFSMLWPLVALVLVLFMRHTGKKFFFSIVLIGLFLFVGVNQACTFSSVK